MTGNHDKKTSRRDILLTTAAAFGGAAASDSMHILSYLTKLVAGNGEGAIGPKHRNQKFESIFGNRIEQFSIDEGVVHRNFNGPIHIEDNLRTVIGLGNLLANEIQPLPIHEAKIIRNPDLLNKDIISIGSVESNYTAQLAHQALQQYFGNELDSLLRWRIKRNYTAETKRYMMNPEALNSDKLREMENLNQLDGERDVWISRNSGIQDFHQDTLQGPKLYTKNEIEGFIDKDLLLINKLPNIITEAASGAGSYFVQFAGTRGVGTKGVLEILKDGRLLNKLQSKAEDSQYFQAVFLVSAKHDHQKTISIPDEVETAERWFNDWFHEVEL